MRIKFILSIFIIIWAVLIIRIYFLTIKSNTFYEELAERNMVKTESLVPIRGLILDRNGEPLAVNRLGFSISLQPALSSPKREAELRSHLESVIEFFPNFKLEELLKTYIKRDSPYNHDPIKIIEFIPYEDMHTIYPKIFQNRYIKIEPSTTRYYPNGTLASHVIGYAGRANRKDVESDKIAKLTGMKGKNGLEKEYDDFLKGELGLRRVKVTAFNQEIGEIERVNPKENNNLILGLDIRIQNVLNSGFEGKNGAAVVMDARSGEILATGSYPEYDINDFVTGISQKKWDELINSPYHPFTNKLINGLYPPGSTIKMGVAMSFLEHGAVTEDEVLYCPESITLGDREFRDWKKGGHGNTDIIKAIKRSVDVYFYKLSLKTGIDNIAKTLINMGFSKKSGIDLPNEFYGVVPSSAWKQRRYNQPWYMGETVVSSIGQGYFLATPLQVARYTALMATGKLPRPHLVKNIGDSEVKIESEDVLSEFLKEKLPFIQEGMRQVCEEQGGTAFWYTREAKVDMGCKTGTAQVVEIPQGIEERMDEEDMEYFHRSHAWLTAYVPFENPKYVITTMVEHGGHGGSAAGGIISSVVNKLLELGYIENPK